MTTLFDDFYPRLVRIDATWRCNLNCKHCQTGMFRGPDHPEDLTTEELVGLFHQLAAMGTRYVGFLGGEPLLRRDLRTLLDELRALDILPTITTNGLNISEELADYLVNDARSTMVVSLDGADQPAHEYIRGRGTWPRTMTAIKRLHAARNGHRGERQLGISAVLHQRNKHQAVQFIRLADELGVDHLTLAAVHRVGNAVRAWDELALSAAEVRRIADELAAALQSRTSGCDVSVNFFTPAYREFAKSRLGFELPSRSLIDQASLFECYVQCDGRVFPSQKCSEMVPDVLIGAARELGITFRENSIRSRSFSDIWWGADFTRYRTMMLTKQHIAGYSTCRRCPMSKTTCLPAAGAYLLEEQWPEEICVDALAGLGR